MSLSILSLCKQAGKPAQDHVPREGHLRMCVLEGEVSGEHGRGGHGMVRRSPWWPSHTYHCPPSSRGSPSSIDHPQPTHPARTALGWPATSILPWQPEVLGWSRREPRDLIFQGSLMNLNEVEVGWTLTWIQLMKEMLHFSWKPVNIKQQQKKNPQNF